MVLEVRLYATLRSYGGQQAGGVVAAEVPEEVTVQELLQQLGIPADEVKLAMVNGIHVELEHRLSACDRIALFPPVGGG